MTGGSTRQQFRETFGWSVAGRWQLKYFVCSPRTLGKMNPFLTILCFKWVAQPPSRLLCWHPFFLATKKKVWLGGSTLHPGFCKWRFKLGFLNPGAQGGAGPGFQGMAVVNGGFLSISWVPCRHGRSFREVHLQRLKHFGRYELLICCDAPHLLDSRSWKLEVKTLCPRVSLDEVLSFTYGETLRKLCTRFPWFRIHDMN